MRAFPIAMLCIFLCCMAMPVLAEDGSRYSYIRITDMDVKLDHDQATISVNYTLDSGIQLIVYLLGKQDLKNKLVKVLNYEDVTVQSVELNHAEFLVNDASYDYGRGIYWFPEHEFNTLIPNLRVNSPQVIREYNNTRVFPDGIGYFE